MRNSCGCLTPDVVHFHHFLLLGIDLITLTRRMLPDARIVLTLHEFMVDLRRRWPDAAQDRRLAVLARIGRALPPVLSGHARRSSSFCARCG